MYQPYICEGEHVGLRVLDPLDLAGDYPKWLNDAEVCRFNSHAVFPAMLAELERYVASVSTQPDKLILAIVDKMQGRHIGNVSLQRIHPVYRSAELAILLGDKSSWGKGIGAESCELIVRHGFTKLNLHRIHCGTAEGNLGMRRIAERLGMRQEGIRREALYLEGKYVDLYEYGVLRDEFLAR